MVENCFINVWTKVCAYVRDTINGVLSFVNFVVAIHKTLARPTALPELRIRGGGGGGPSWRLGGGSGGPLREVLRGMRRGRQNFTFQTSSIYKD